MGRCQAWIGSIEVGCLSRGDERNTVGGWEQRTGMISPRSGSLWLQHGEQTIGVGRREE